MLQSVWYGVRGLIQTKSQMILASLLSEIKHLKRAYQSES
jgi:hypothetical protein